MAKAVLNGGRQKAASQGRNDGAGVRRAQKPVAPELKAKLAEFEALCRELGEEPASVALAWLLVNPVVTAPIIGPRTLEQLEGAARSLEIKLGPESLKRLDEIFPGPGNQVPEAYAW